MSTNLSLAISLHNIVNHPTVSPEEAEAKGRGFSFISQSTYVKKFPVKSTLVEEGFFNFSGVRARLSARVCEGYAVCAKITVNEKLNFIGLYNKPIQQPLHAAFLKFQEKIRHVALIQFGGEPTISYYVVGGCQYDSNDNVDFGNDQEDALLESFYVREYKNRVAPKPGYKVDVLFTAGHIFYGSEIIDMQKAVVKGTELFPANQRA